MKNDIFREDLFETNHAVVSGGSSGVGLGIARRFAAKGASVTLLARDEEKLNQASDHLSDDYGAEAIGLSVDVRDFERLEEVFEQGRDSFGTVDVLVCAAAGNFPAAASEMSANAFKSVVDIDLLGTFNTCRAAYDHLEKPGSSIIGISAPQSEQPMPFQSHAGAAKAGVDNLIRNLALEWSDDGIRANAIQPGPVEGTEGLERLTPDQEAKDNLAEALPMGRLVQKNDIGNFCLYLASDAAEAVTGTIIPVDSGMMLGGSASFLSALR